MKLRIGQLIGGVVEGMPWLGTFHAIGVKILRRHAELVDLKPSFTVLDTDDQIRLLKQLLDAENIDEKRWPARRARVDDRRLEEPRAYAQAGAGRRELRLRQRQSARALCALSAAPEGAQRRRFRRSAAGKSAAVPGARRRARRNTSSASSICWWTSIRTPTSRNICGCGCWRRATAIFAASATTISRSMAGAAPRWTTSCASRPTFPAPRSSGSNATTARPAISSARPRA